MNFLRFNSLLFAGCVSLAAVGAATAGGFSRGTADTDILFEEGNFNMRSSVTIVSPGREFSSVPVFDTANLGHDYADTYAIPSAAVKFRIVDNLSCAGTIVQAYGASSSYAGPKYSASPALGKTSESFTVMEYGATCGFRYDLSRGRITILGGIFIENFNYDLEVEGNPLALPGAVVGVDLRGNAVGWRAGLAYEIPEIALRAQLLYRSGTSVSADGTTTTANSPFLPSGTAGGTGDLPQNVELKLQSGIAPGWLAYGVVRWTDWSVNETLNLMTTTGFTSQNRYFWKDGWTVTAGIGHAFSDSVSGTTFLTWDRGVSTGYDLMADVYTFGAGASFKDTMGGELRLGGAVSYLGSAAETENGGFNYAVGNDWSLAGSAGYVVRW